MKSSENSPSRSPTKLLTINLISNDHHDTIALRRDSQMESVHSRSYENSVASLKKESLNNENNNLDSRFKEHNAGSDGTYGLEYGYNFIDSTDGKDMPTFKSTAKKNTVSKKIKDDDRSISRRKSKSRINSRSNSPTERYGYERDSHCNKQHNFMPESNSNLKRIVKINKMPPRAEKTGTSNKKSPDRIRQKLYFEESNTSNADSGPDSLNYTKLTENEVPFFERMIDGSAIYKSPSTKTKKRGTSRSDSQRKLSANRSGSRNMGPDFSSAKKSSKSRQSLKIPGDSFKKSRPQDRPSYANEHSKQDFDSGKISKLELDGLSPDQLQLKLAERNIAEKNSLTFQLAQRESELKACSKFQKKLENLLQKETEKTKRGVWEVEKLQMDLDRSENTFNQLKKTSVSKSAYINQNRDLTNKKLENEELLQKLAKLEKQHEDLDMLKRENVQKDKDFLNIKKTNTEYKRKHDELRNLMDNSINEKDKLVSNVEELNKENKKLNLETNKLLKIFSQYNDKCLQIAIHISDMKNDPERLVRGDKAYVIDNDHRLKNPSGVNILDPLIGDDSDIADVTHGSIKKIKDEFDNFLEKCRNLFVENGHFRREIDSLKHNFSDSIKTKNKDTDCLLKEKDKLYEDVNFLMNESEGLKAENHSQKLAKDSLERQNNLLKDQKQNLLDNTNDLTSQNQKDLEDLQEKVYSQEGEKDNLQSQKANAEKMVKSLKADKNFMNEKIIDMQNEKDQLSEDVMNRNDEIDRNKKKLNFFEAQYEKARKESDLVRERLGDLENKNEKSSMNDIRIQSEIDSLKLANNALEKQLKSVKIERHDLKNTNEDSQNELYRLNSELGERQDELRTLKRNIIKLEDQNKSVRQDYEKDKDRQKFLEEDYQYANNHKKDQEFENEKINHDFEDAAYKNKRLEDELRVAKLSAEGYQNAFEDEKVNLFKFNNNL